MKLLPILACLLLPAILTAAPIPLLDDDIGEAIFHEGRQYLIYVHPTPSIAVLAAFEQFCAGGKLCAILNSENEIYDRITEFVGFYQADYFLLFDIENRRKYCLPAREGVASKEINEFYQGFLEGTVDPYFTSEPVPQQQLETHMKKVVGLTFQEFLDQPEVVRVLFLYTEDELCSNCHQVYLAVSESAKAFAGRGVEFGFLDLFKNQHKDLKEQDVPLLLLYRSNSREYIRLDSQGLATLAPTLEEWLGGEL